MEFRPILSAILRNKTGAVLIALQVAITMAVIVNAGFIISDRIGQLARPAGVDVDNIISAVSIAFEPDYDNKGAVRADLEMLQNLPGVVAAGTSSSIPLSDSGWSTSMNLDPEKPEVYFDMAVYGVDHYALEAFGIELLEGRWFREDELVHASRSERREVPVLVVMGKNLAEHVFPGESAVGKQIHHPTGEAVTVIGVVSDVATPWPHTSEEEVGGLYRTSFLPVRFERVTDYVIRTEPGERDRLLPVIEEKLIALNRGRTVSSVRTMTDIVDDVYGPDKATIRILWLVIVFLVVITSLGIVGLASFNVRQRTKQIGTRRAIGATRTDILRYFMLENAMITTIGVLLGSVLTVGLNYWLVSHYNIPRLEMLYLPAGILSLLFLGQIATLVPAHRATLVPPAVATRTI